MAHKEMKKYYCWIFLLVAMGCHQYTETRVRVHLKAEYAGEKVELTTVDSVYKTVADSLAEAVFVLPERFASGYGTCYFKINWIPVYLEPGKDFEMAFEGDSIYFVGKGSVFNNYLNSPFFRNEKVKYELGEEMFIESLKQRLSEAYQQLDKVDLEESLKQMERKRLHYAVFRRLGNYPYWHARIGQLSGYKASDDFVAFYRSVAQEDDALTNLGEYRQFFQGLVSLVGEQGGADKDRVQVLRDRVTYIDRHIQGERLAAYLTDVFMNDHLNNYGVDGWEDLLAFYDAKVTDQEKKAAFKELYATWSRLAKGQPSPVFQYSDVEGKLVDLADLSGKYVYIDVWATWCYFCCKEIPALKELEHKFANRNIHFVSISSDQDQEVWKKKVKEDKLGGIQLNIGNNRSFMNSYMIRGIPRFILLDREGRILDANMTRPSDPRTLRMLNALPGI